MSVITSKVAPYSGLCRFCLNLAKTQNYAPDTYEQEGLAHMSCQAIPGLVFTIDKKEDLYYIGETDVDDAGNLIGVLNNISNCNKFLPGAELIITDVQYDDVALELTVSYSLDGVVGNPDLNFYYIGNGASIQTVSGVSDGDYTTVISGALADGTYYIWMQLSTTEQSNIYPFEISTIT